MTELEKYKFALQTLLSVIECDKDGDYFICEECAPIVDRCQALVDGKIDGELSFEDRY